MWWIDFEFHSRLFFILVAYLPFKKVNWDDRHCRDAMIIIDFDSTGLRCRRRKRRGRREKGTVDWFPFAALLFPVPLFAPTIVGNLGPPFFTRNWETIKNKSSNTRGLFLQSPDNVSAPKSGFVFVVFAFKIKVPINLKMTWKQNWLVCELGTVVLFNRFWL